MSASEVLGRITAALESAGISYMLTGSYAGAHHGAPRSTLDIDIVISATPDQLRRFVNSLPSGEYYADVGAALEAQIRESMFNVIDIYSGWKIDFIIRKSRAFSREEFDRRKRLNIQGLNVFVATAEDVVIAKLEWSRLAQSRRQIEDVASILRLQGGSLDQRYLKKWISGLNLEKEWSEARRLAEISES